MAAKCEIFMNYSKYFIGIYKNKSDCQMSNTNDIINVKEQDMAYRCKKYEAVRCVYSFDVKWMVPIDEDVGMMWHCCQCQWHQMTKKLYCTTFEISWHKECKCAI